VGYRTTRVQKKKNKTTPKNPKQAKKLKARNCREERKLYRKKWGGVGKKNKRAEAQKLRNHGLTEWGREKSEGGKEEAGEYHGATGPKKWKKIFRRDLSKGGKKNGHVSHGKLSIKTMKKEPWE